MEDQEIIDLYLRRNEQAIVESERKYGTFCMGIAMNILSNHQDAEECVNDTWRSVWGHIPPDLPRCLRTYIGHIIRRISIDRFRYVHAARRNKDLEVALEELENCIGTAGETETEAGRRLLEDINAFLWEQSKTDRVIFVLRYYHAMPLTEVAPVVGMRANAAGKRLTRTREKLRAYLTERGYRL